MTIVIMRSPLSINHEGPLRLRRYDLFLPRSSSSTSSSTGFSFVVECMRTYSRNHYYYCYYDHIREEHHHHQGKREGGKRRFQGCGDKGLSQHDLAFWDMDLYTYVVGQH